MPSQVLRRAALHPQTAVPTAEGHAAGTATEQAVFDANLRWEHDRALVLERSARRGWTVAAIAILLAFFAVLAVFVQGPLRQVVGVPIVVDRTTGETTIQQRLSVETIPAQEALDKHQAAVWVRAREGYSWWWLQRDYDAVARMAVPAVFNDYARLFDGDQALQKKIGGTQEWRINVIGVRLSPLGRQGNRGEAVVTYDKVVRVVDRALPDQTTRYVASLVYEYQPKALAKETDRMENPFGFTVTAYRADPEVSPSGPKASGTAP